MLSAKVLIGLLWAASAALGLETPNKEHRDASNNITEEDFMSILTQMVEDKKIKIEDIVGGGTQSEKVQPGDMPGEGTQNEGVQYANGTKTHNEDTAEEVPDNGNLTKLEEEVKNMTMKMMMGLAEEKEKEKEAGNNSIINGLNVSDVYRASDDVGKLNPGNETHRNITELYFNRPLTYAQYQARNWMWLRCRTWTLNRFDAGGSWVADGGAAWRKEASKTKCGVVNWDTQFVNEQGWGDIYTSWDWMAIGCGQVKAVQAAVKAARKTANETRRELYIYNCRGFDDYPWSFVEMRRGAKEPTDDNSGFGLDPAATQEQKWNNDEGPIGYMPLKDAGSLEGV